MRQGDALQGVRVTHGTLHLNSSLNVWGKVHIRQGHPPFPHRYRSTTTARLHLAATVKPPRSVKLLKFSLNGPTCQSRRSDKRRLRRVADAFRIHERAHGVSNQPGRWPERTVADREQPVQAR